MDLYLEWTFWTKYKSQCDFAIFMPEVTFQHLTVATTENRFCIPVKVRRKNRKEQSNVVYCEVTTVYVCAAV